MLTRMVEVGDRILTPDGREFGIVHIDGSIAYFSEYLEHSGCFNCFIARFSDGKLNSLFTLVE